MMIALLLAVILWWDAPTLTCAGGPFPNPANSLDHYVVPVFQVRVVGIQPCDTDNPALGACPMYDKVLTRYCVPPNGPACDGKPFPCLQLGPLEPAVGEVLGWNIPEAIDVLAQSSAQCSEPAAPTDCIPVTW